LTLVGNEVLNEHFAELLKEVDREEEVAIPIPRIIFGIGSGGFEENGNPCDQVQTRF